MLVVENASSPESENRDTRKEIGNTAARNPVEEKKEQGDTKKDPITIRNSPPSCPLQNGALESENEKRGKREKEGKVRTREKSERKGKETLFPRIDIAG